MHLVYGGAYQGKMTWAKENFSIPEDEIHICSDSAEPDWTKRCIAHLERYVRFCVSEGKEIDLSRLSSDCVCIVDDISSGIVPMDPVDRLWREECGRFTVRLSKQAESVTRLFCGIPQKLK